MSDEKLIKKFKRMFKCDAVRISRPMKKLFLIIGFRRHTKDDKLREWTDGYGNRIDFEYIHDTVIASGNDEKELIESAKEFKSYLKTDARSHFIHD